MIPGSTMATYSCAHRGERCAERLAVTRQEFRLTGPSEVLRHAGWEFSTLLRGWLCPTHKEGT